MENSKCNLCKFFTQENSEYGECCVNPPSKSWEELPIVSGARYACRFFTKKPIAKSTKKPIEKSTKKPIEKPTKKPIEKPTKKTIVKPTKKPIEKSTKKPIEKPTKKPIGVPPSPRNRRVPGIDLPSSTNFLHGAA